MVKYLLLITIIVISFYPAVNAQTEVDSGKVNAEFRLALDLYKSQQFNEAQQIFNKIIHSYNFNLKTTISYIFDAKSLIKLKLNEAAKLVLNEFLTQYDSSKYKDEAELMLAEINVDKESYYNAFKILSHIIESSDSPFYYSYAQSSGEKIALHFLSSDQIKNLYDSTDNSKLKSFLLLTLGKFYLQNQDFKDAEASLSDLIHLYPASEERGEAVTLYQRVLIEKETSPTTPLIGVMLPFNYLSNDTISNAGSEILEGIKFAVAQYNKNHDQKVGLIIRNTERNKNKIEDIEKEFAAISSIKIIIGPIFSDEVKETLDAFKNTDIPIISPTATENDLTELYPNFFQANPSFTVRGKVMAEYIYYVENKKLMSVLNADEGYSPILADVFFNEFNKLGGQILTQQTYHSNSMSYSEQVSQIAKDSLQLQGVYMPLADNRDVPALLSQFVANNLNVPIYGNQDWFLAKGYETNPTLSNMITFTSDYYIDYSDSLFHHFSRQFLAQTNIDVDRNVLYGYDTANYLLSVVKDFNTSRESIMHKMESGVVFKGFHNNYYFDQTRVNSFLNIVRYRDGKFELVDKFKLTN
jgi:branched-chain amino acid transport system substrate-binding protein